MRFRCERQSLADAVAIVSRFADRKSGIPILSHILFEPGDGGVKVVATDLDRAASAFFPADIAGSDGVCVPVEILAKILSKFIGSEVDFSDDGITATIRISKSRSDVPILPAEDFPRPSMLLSDGESQFNLPADLLNRIEKQVAFAASDNIARSALCGTCWSCADGVATFVALDGHTLSALRIEAGMCDLPERIVPSIHLPFRSGDAHIDLSYNFARFSQSGVSIATKLMDGQFPQWPRAVPVGGRSITFKREELLRAVESVSINADNGVRHHSILIDGRDGVATLSTQGNKGDVFAEVGFEGGDFQNAFTVRILSPALKAIDGEIVELLHSDPPTGSILREPGDDSHQIVIIPFHDRRLMPVRQEVAA